MTIFKTVGELNTCLTLFSKLAEVWELTQTNIETLGEDRYTRDVHALSLRKLTLINQEVTYIAYLKYSHLHIT